MKLYLKTNSDTLGFLIISQWIMEETWFPYILKGKEVQ